MEAWRILTVAKSGSRPAVPAPSQTRAKDVMTSARISVFALPQGMENQI